MVFEFRIDADIPLSLFRCLLWTGRFVLFNFQIIFSRRDKDSGPPFFRFVFSDMSIWLWFVLNWCVDGDVYPVPWTEMKLSSFLKFDISWNSWSHHRCHMHSFWNGLKFFFVTRRVWIFFSGKQRNSTNLLSGLKLVVS